MPTRKRISSASISARAPPHLRGERRDHLRVVGRTAQETTTTSTPADVRRRVAVGRPARRGRQPLGDRVGLQVRALHRVAEVQQHLGDAAHAAAADADEVDALDAAHAGVHAGLRAVADEFKRALAWTKANCPEGREYNPPEKQRSPTLKDQDWETVVKMTLIARDLLVGNPRLAELDWGEEALGHNAILGGFQGQRQWTDHFPNGDFMEAMLNSSFDWNGVRPPFVFATENDSLNGASMLFGHLLTNTAQVFADVRTYWSPAAVKRVTGYELNGPAAGGLIHLINSGAATLDATGRMEKDGLPAMKPFWEIS